MALVAPTTAPITEAPPPTTTTEAPTTTTTEAPVTTTAAPPETTTTNVPTSDASPATTTTDGSVANPSPSPDQSGNGGGSSGGKATKTKSSVRTATGSGLYPTQVSGSVGNSTGSDTANSISGGPSDNDGSSKSLAGPIVGGIAGALVLAFLVAVFVMRYRKKSKARQRRLDILLDPEQAQALGLSGGSNASGKPRPTSVNSPIPKPSTQLEMAPITSGPAPPGAGGPIHHSDGGYNGYDYQQGYQNVSYGGYQDQYEQYDQYDPYYQQPIPTAQPVMGQLQPTGYYPDSPRQQQQLAHLQQQRQPYGSGSPSICHSSPASQNAYPQQIYATGSSPLVPHQQQAAPAESYERFNKVESSDYIASQSPARNPQIIS
ncbi:hypothetical protein BGZ80_000634 [Entomortierella chlamydospora]|uniref:Uncharacterized protein n=1 Tax=Entomortierella chlamydospora TaxID=101097 RepID=A0A9P6MRX2_9FUNG|nr:hypothetical protein BGZ79_006415 [Entomortierella chlamydospora]KAG0011508.1 hypothetical protein BGZ80_000634 [Entomortierella chlamydospora]